MRFWNHDGACDGDTGGSGSTSLLDSMLSTEKMIRTHFSYDEIDRSTYSLPLYRKRLQVRKLIVTKAHPSNHHQGKRVRGVTTLLERGVTKRPYFKIFYLIYDSKQIKIREVSGVKFQNMIKDSMIWCSVLHSHKQTDQRQNQIDINSCMHVLVIKSMSL